MKNKVITEGIWDEITKAAKKAKNNSFIAVAYFSSGASTKLPLKTGSKLIVDASEGTVKGGLTKPSELIELYKKGVEIYNLNNLHAKIYVLDRRLFFGSINVSNSDLQEAVIESTDPKLISEAKRFVKQLCTIDRLLGIKTLIQLQKIYRTPRGVNRARREKGISKNKSFISKLEYIDEYLNGYKKPLKQGKIESKKKIINNKQHKLDWFEWDAKLIYKEGDIITQVVKDGDEEWIFPPARLINIKKWRNDKSKFVFLEIPRKKEKPLSRLPKSFEKSIFKRSSKLSQATIKKINSLWV